MKHILKFNKTVLKIQIKLLLKTFQREKSMEQKENRNAEIEETRRNEDRELLKKILAEQVCLSILD